MSVQICSTEEQPSETKTHSNTKANGRSRCLELHRFLPSRFALLLGLAVWMPAAMAQKKPPSPVTLAEARMEAMREEIVLSGTSLAWRRVALSPRVEGLVASIAVDEGSWVRAGDPILELDTQLADIEIDTAAARLDGATARHKDTIRKRDELLRLQQGQHVSETSIASAAAEVEIKAAELAEARAELAKARELRERHAVRAPFAGMVVSKRVEIGQWVRLDDTLVDLVELDRLRVKAPIAQRYFPRVSVGEKARVRFDALPDRDFEGKVYARVALGNESSRSFPLLIDVANPDHLLAPGMSARIHLPLDGGATRALTVPRDAVVVKSDGNRELWRVSEADGRFTVSPVRVETGRAQGDRLELLAEEVHAGDGVVLLGNENLRAGQEVRPLPAAAPAADR